MNFLRQLYVAPLRFYRKFISPLKPPMCRFNPTCSKYGIEAVLQHGILKGSALAVWRILRCQPFASGGYDPVPPPSRSNRGGRTGRSAHPDGPLHPEHPRESDREK